MRAKTQMVRIDAGLWSRINKAGSHAGRTARQEIELRLRNSLDGIGEAPASVHPKAAAFGRLTAHLANSVIAYSTPADTKVMLKAAVNWLLEKMGATEPTEEVKFEARTFAEYLLLTLANAEARSFADGVPAPLSQEQLEFVEIREALGDWAIRPGRSVRNDRRSVGDGKKQ